MEYLVEKGADLVAKDEVSNKNIADAEFRYIYFKIACYLWVTQDEWTALTNASAGGHLSVVAYLLVDETRAGELRQVSNRPAVTVTLPCQYTNRA